MSIILKEQVKCIKISLKYFSIFSASPSKIKRVQQKEGQYRRKFYTQRYKNRQLQQKVTNLQTVVNVLKKEQLLSENALYHVKKSYDGIPSLIMARYLKNIDNKTITHETYPAPLREFAATLHFYSNKAYEYVRREFALALPHQSTIRKWFSNVDCSPGFISAAFHALKCQAEQYEKVGRELICSLMLDEMSVRKQIEFDGHEMWGYVNVGIATNNDELETATEVLVLMVVANQNFWKIPIAYFLIKGLSGKEKANVVRESLQRLHEVGVKITTVTCDGPSGNFMMFKELGCNFENPFEMKTFFEHPANSSLKVYAVFDACHMLKLYRNTLASLGEIKDPEGHIVSWQFIVKLHELQEKEGLLFANKIKRAHIEWYKQKMKVC